MLHKTIKRFYKQAACAQTEDGFAIQLDGKGIKTPLGKKLAVPSRALADAIAAEWQEQGETIRPDSMAMTQLASTALDRVGPERATITKQMLNFAGTDLLCYRADAPSDLVERQARQWQPILDWAAKDLGAPLTATCGVIAIAQPDKAIAALEAKLESYDVWVLTAAQAMTAAMGSLILALAITEGRLSADAAFGLSQLDETYQIEHWGEDAEAAERRTLLERDILSAARFFQLIAQ